MTRLRVIDGVGMMYTYSWWCPCGRSESGIDSQEYAGLLLELHRLDQTCDVAHFGDVGPDHSGASQGKRCFAPLRGRWHGHVCSRPAVLNGQPSQRCWQHQDDEGEP